MVRVRSAEYFKEISSVVPGLSLFGSTWKPAMKPSRSRMPARDSLSLEPGIFTVSNMAELALRIRVSMSAMGSVIVMVDLPTRLCDAGYLPGVHHHTQADTAEPELAVHGFRPATPLAAGVAPHLELGCALLLLNQSLFCHDAYRVSCRNGKPNAARNARPSSFVRAVVTMVMSMPRTLSMRS